MSEVKLVGVKLEESKLAVVTVSFEGKAQLDRSQLLEARHSTDL